MRSRLKTTGMAGGLLMFFFSLTSVVFAAAEVRNIRVDPAYVCPGQAVTIHYEARHDINNDLAMLGAFSANNTALEATADLFFLHGDEGGFGGDNTPQTVDSWTAMPAAGANVAVTIFLPYSVVTTVPAGYSDGQTVNIVLAAKNGWGSAAGPFDDVESLPVTVSCTLSLVTNTGGFWHGSATEDVIIDESCNTPTFTPTATITDTPTATATVTYTDTFTFTPTLTNTNTATPTVTDTFTFTATSTYTQSFTPTITVTVPGSPTFTPTVTPTITNTVTFTPSSSFTSSSTLTATPTQTVTGTVTSTFTPSFTLTATTTFTPTVTDTITPGPTPTNTVTYTYTPTSTETSTLTPTFTETATGTFTSTVTDTITPGPSPTETVTFTQTATPTASYTLTRTRTVTPTPTFSTSFTQTYTATPTFTNTAEFTSTNTPSYTSTFTFTQTSTLTMTATRTATITLTSTQTQTSTFTSTLTATMTQTPSVTASTTRTMTLSYTHTPTMTPTPVKEPFRVVMGAYNSAGERVRLLFDGSAQVLGNKLRISEGVVVSGRQGIEVGFPGSLTGPGAYVHWDGRNDSGQAVGGGMYYIKAEVIDSFGKVTAMIEPVQVIEPKAEAILAIGTL